MSFTAITPFEDQLPDSNDPASFDARATALMSWIVSNFGPEVEALAVEIAAALDGEASTLDAVATLSSALAALGTAGTAADYRAAIADKVLRAHDVWEAAQLVGLTDAASIAIDFDTGFNFEVTLGGNRTLATPTNAKVGQRGTIVFNQDATGGRTLALASGWLTEGGAGISLSSGANAKDAVMYEVLATSPGLEVAIGLSWRGLV